MTPFNLRAEVKGQIQHSQAMTSYKLFAHSEPLGAILGGNIGPF